MRAQLFRAARHGGPEMTHGQGPNVIISSRRRRSKRKRAESGQWLPAASGGASASSCLWRKPR